MRGRLEALLAVALACGAVRGGTIAGFRRLLNASDPQLTTELLCGSIFDALWPVGQALGVLHANRVTEEHLLSRLHDALQQRGAL